MSVDCLVDGDLVTVDIIGDEKENNGTAAQVFIAFSGWELLHAT